MTGAEGLNRINDTDSIDNIKEITKVFVNKVDPLKVILFGSFAEGSYNDESDYDFYIVVDDERNVSEATDDAYIAAMGIKRRPVDIVVGTNRRFEQKRNSQHSLMIEREVERNGILLYDRKTGAMV